MPVSLPAASIFKRWIRFYSVGTIGILVQLSVLAFLISIFKLNYLIATGLAVETAILHNFLWHETWTWADRAKRSPISFWRRLLYFHLVNGSLSIVGNVVLMKFLMEALQWSCLQANVAAIAACSILNFIAGDFFVYRASGVKMSKNSIRIAASAFIVCSAIFLLHASLVQAAELQPETLKAWSNYVNAAEKRINTELSSKTGFLSLDFKSPLEATTDRKALISGNILIENVTVDLKFSGKIPDGMIHHWRGFVFIPGVNLDEVLSRVENPTAENLKQEDVKDSRLLEKSPGQLRLFLKLRRSKIVTVVYNTEHLIKYSKCSDAQAWSSSIATKIREVENFQKIDEHEKPEGQDSGFLWRLNSYWRYQQVAGGVIVECESLTLSRSIPLIVSLVVERLITNVARESMQRTLHSLRARMVREKRPLTASQQAMRP